MGGSLGYLKRVLFRLAPLIVLVGACAAWAVVTPVLNALHEPDGGVTLRAGAIGFGIECLLVGCLSLLLAFLETPKGKWPLNHLWHAWLLYGVMLFSLWPLVTEDAGHLSGLLTFMLYLAAGAAAGNAIALYWHQHSIHVRAAA